MTDYQQVLNDVKSDVLTFVVNSYNELTRLSEYFPTIQRWLNKYFQVKKSAFLAFESNTLFPVHEVDLFEVKTDVIPWSIFSTFFYQQKIASVPLFLQEKLACSELTDMVLCSSHHKDPAGVLLVQGTELWDSFTQSLYFDEFIDLITQLIYTVNHHVQVLNAERQYRKLYNMTELFHSTMDIDVILENVLHTMQENFQDLEVDLILSNDQDRQTKINIKLFDYLSERPSTIEAFVSGEITVELAEDLNQRILNAPLMGRQAIYGILQVRAPKRYIFTNLQKDFIRKLANASGNALENAKLYHQSHRLISDLQLINETSHRLNSKLDINEMLVFLTKQLVKSFQPMEVGFILENNSVFEVAEGSTPIFMSDEGRVYIEHAEKHFKKATDSLFIADFSRLISEAVQYYSIMAIPMIVEERLTGFCIVLHKESYFFSFDSFKLMQSLIHHSSLAIANSKLRNQLQDMVDRDHLTKLYARSYLDRFVENSLQQDDAGMFLLIDIDNFKHVNDTYGHQVGDKILVQIANQLKSTIGIRGICARWGGEELSVYVPNTLQDEALKIAEQLVEIVPKTTTPAVTISAGLVIWDKSNRPLFQSIFLQADTALYKAKNSGKNQFCFYDDSLQFN